MAEIDLTLIGTTVLEARAEARQFRTEVLTELRGMRDDQTVMIRMLQAREAELDLMRSPEQHDAGLRARVVEVEQRQAKLEATVS
jgi:hypothetical protein